MSETKVAVLICEYTSDGWRLLPWVQLQLLDSSILCKALFRNPHCRDLISTQQVPAHKLAENPAEWALDLLETVDFEQHPHCLYWLCLNKNPRALSIVEKYESLLDHDDWEAISSNPTMLPLLLRNLDKVKEAYVMWNSKAQDLIHKLQFPICEIAIQNNSSDWAIEWMKQHPITEYFGFAANPHPWVVAQLLEHPNKFDISTMCANPNPAIMPILEARKSFITKRILENPNAFFLAFDEHLLPILLQLFLVES